MNGTLKTLTAAPVGGRAPLDFATEVAEPRASWSYGTLSRHAAEVGWATWVAMPEQQSGCTYETALCAAP